MNRMLVWAMSLVTPAVLLCSCEDKEKLKQEAALQQELTKLESEISTMESQIRKAPQDRSKELDGLTKKLETIDADIAEQEANLADIRQRENELKADFESYKATYPVP